MTVLVLGAAGAVGSAVVRRASSLGLEVHGVVRETTPRRRLAGCRVELHEADVRDPERLTAILRRVRPRVVVDAAFVGGYPVDGEARRAMATAALETVIAIFAAIRAVAPQARLIHLGSGTVYGAGPGPHETSERLEPTTLRGAVKAAQSLLVRRLAAEDRVAAVELRLFSAYGPFEQRERLLPTLFSAALVGSRVALTATPTRRDWVHFDDVARAVLAAATADLAEVGPVVHVCTGRAVDTHALARLVETVTGASLVGNERYERPDPYGPGSAGKPPDAALGWSPEISLEAGVESTWGWAQTREGRSYLLDPPPGR